MKYVWWIVLIVLAGLVLWRMLTPEDAWICKSGQWVQHGKPSTPMPTVSCAAAHGLWGTSSK